MSRLRRTWFGLEVQNTPKATGSAAAESPPERVGFAGWGKRCPNKLSGVMPEDIVLRPETDCVARFVQSITTLKYISAVEIRSHGDVVRV